jgi:hypothetical protein
MRILTQLELQLKSDQQVVHHSLAIYLLFISSCGNDAAQDFLTLILHFSRMKKKILLTMLHQKEVPRDDKLVINIFNFRSFQ